MDVSGELQDLAALSPRKVPQVPIEQEEVWVQTMSVTFREKSCRKSNQESPTFHSVG